MGQWRTLPVTAVTPAVAMMGVVGAVVAVLALAGAVGRVGRDVPQATDEVKLASLGTKMWVGAAGTEGRR